MIVRLLSQDMQIAIFLLSIFTAKKKKKEWILCANMRTIENNPYICSAQQFYNELMQDEGLHYLQAFFMSAYLSYQ